MKKLFTLLLALVATTALWAHDFEVDGIYYNYLDGNNVEITYCGVDSYSYDNEYAGKVIIPSTVTYYGTTYSVTSIGNEAFEDCSSLSSITIPNSVTSIGERAFDGCSSLTSITIPNSVTSIGESAFEYCSSLISVTIGNSVTSIGKYAFLGCSSLTSVTIPESVTSIGDWAFAGCCSSLTSIVVETGNTTYDSRDNCNAIIETATNTLVIGCKNTIIPNSVTSIGDIAFYYCSSLTSITIPNSVISIGTSAFYGCSSLTSPVYNAHCFAYMPTSFKGAYVIPEGIKKIAGGAFDGCSSLTSVTIPNSVTSIGNGAFYGCSSLTSVTLPNSVTSIGESAFEYCSSLTSVTIGNSVTSIGESAFKYCSKLTSITIPNSVTSIGDEAFYGTGIYDNESNWENGLLYISHCLIVAKDDISGAYIIKEDTRLIADEAFYWCSSLTSVTIPNSVTSIGISAFNSCSSLTSVTIPNSVTSIGEWAFYGCSSLTSVTIPNSVTSIGISAFNRCSSLTSVTIPNSVTSIGEWAFYGCSSLTSVTIPNSVTSIGEDAFKYCSSLTKTNYTGDIAGWCNIMFGSNYANPMYCSHNFYINDQEIKDLVIPNNVTSIGSYAFNGCSSLTSVTIPNSVTSVGNSAFYDCSSLTKTNYTGDIAGWCNIKFGSGSANPMYCSHNFYINDQEIKDLVIPNSVTSIGGSAFFGCSSLTSVTIPNSVTNIGAHAFNSCSSLTSITIPNSVTSIGDYAFYKCSSLTSVTIGNSVTSIGNWAFYKCSSLTSVTIGNSVTSIGNWAFDGCSGLTSITSLAEIPPTLGTDVFNRVSEDIPVYVCSVSAYQSAEGWKDFTNIQELLAEYSIAVDVNDSIMGTAMVDYNTYCKGAQITATPNYGFHFVQWSDGNTDNPRILELTQDTILTAEFAINQYSITTTSSHAERGTTQGDTTVNYLEYTTISATANYGYHFTQWNDGNTDNPRTVQVTKDTTYIAEFDKNIYKITTYCDNQMGSVSAPDSAEYLDEVTITATPIYGYHFTQWSDGNTDNPRALVLTQDTTFTAEFVQLFSGQCGDNLYWAYDEDSKKISITGSGDMYNYTHSTQPWLLFQEQITEVTTSNTTSSIGTSAFEGCIRLGKVSLGYGMGNIAANAFAECKRLYDIYVFASYPPFAEESSFANYNVYLYVPCENQRDYILDVVWGEFKFIECIGAESDDTGGDDVTVTPGTNDVTITWPTEDEAETYSIVITKDGEVFCTLTFNNNGQLVSIAFAPGREGNHPAQYAEATANGYRFTVTGLDESTKYGYNLEVKDSNNQTIQSYEGEFTTMSDVTTDMDNVTSTTNVQKFIRDGQLLIIRDGKTYNAQGVELMQSTEE